MSSATATAGALKTTDLDREEGRFNRGGFLLGIGFGGFVDGIVLHQLLQWHHMLTVGRPLPRLDVDRGHRRDLHRDQRHARRLNEQLHANRSG